MDDFCLGKCAKSNLALDVVIERNSFIKKAIIAIDHS